MSAQAGPLSDPDRATVLLDLGALGEMSLADLAASLDAFCRDVEAGAGERFVVVVLPSVGPETGDRAWPVAGTTTADVGRWEKAVRRLERLAAVTLAVGSGHCGGPATDLLLVSDYRLVGDDFVLLVPVNDGHFFPSMTTYRLIQELSGAAVRQLVLWGSDVSAAQAVGWGLVDRVVEEPELPTARAAAEQLLRLQGGAPELRLRRRLMAEDRHSGYDEALGVHLAACDRELRRWVP